MDTRKAIDFSADVIDIRDVLQRLVVLGMGFLEGTLTEDEPLEAQEIHQLLNQLEDKGSAVPFDGHYYPDRLINDLHFREWAIDELSKHVSIAAPLYHHFVIDWDATTENFQRDFRSVRIDGHTYRYR